MAFLTAALYKFVELPDHAALQTPLLALCQTHGIKGTLKLYPGVAEELVATKAFFIRAGLMKDLDIMLGCHVANELATHYGHQENNSGLVSVADYALLRSVLGQPASASATAAAADMNCSGTVTTADYAMLRASLGLPPGPSGLHP